MKVVKDKISQTLKEAAESTRIFPITHIDVMKSILVGQSSELKHTVIVTHSTSNGVMIWYAHDDHCQCRPDEKSITLLLDEAKDREIDITGKELKLPPKELSKVVFSKILSSLQP